MIDHEHIDSNKALGSRIMWMRKARGLTQEQLAQRSDLAADTIRRAEHGEFAPSFTTMRKLAAGLAVPTVALLSDSYDQADDLADQIRALPPREFKSLVAVTKALREWAEIERSRGDR